MLNFAKIAAMAGEPFAGFSSIASTNDWIKQQAKAGAPALLAAVADAQTAGRGRMGKSFLSAAGAGVYLSVLLRPKPNASLAGLTAEAAVEAARAVAESIGIALQIKWINDLILNGRKVAGILCESGFSQGELYAVVGIGINCTPPKTGFPAELVETAGALSPSEIDREALSAALIARFRNLTGSLSEEQHREYCRRSYVLGKPVRWLVNNTEQGRGQAIRFTEEGHLVILQEDGQEASLSTGEISLRLAQEKGL